MTTRTRITDPSSPLIKHSIFHSSSLASPVMASSQLYGSVISPKGKSVASSIAPRFYHVNPSRIPLGQYSGFSFPNIASSERLAVSLHVKNNGVNWPDIGSNSASCYQYGTSNWNLDQPGTNKKHARVHDFAFGIPYGAWLFIMGIIGYLVFRSRVSLVLGVVPGFATVVLGFLSLRVWRKYQSNKKYILGQGVIAGWLTWQYSRAYILTQKFLPWGFYAYLSGAMVCIHTYVVLSGGNPPPPPPPPTPNSQLIIL